MLKPWPENDKTAYFEDITSPILKAIRFAYTLTRKNRGKDIPYNGFDIGRDLKACCLDADFKLKAENLAYSEEDQGRDALEEIVGLAVQLGIEQGRRIALEKDWRPNMMKLYLSLSDEEVGKAYRSMYGEAL